MPRPFDVQFAVVASGTQNADFVSKRGHSFGLWIPTVDSCALTIRGSFDQTSADYLPIQMVAASGTWTLQAGPGSVAAVLMDQDGIQPFPYLRVFLGVAQTAPRTLALISKPYWMVHG